MKQWDSKAKLEDKVIQRKKILYANLEKKAWEQSIQLAQKRGGFEVPPFKSLQFGGGKMLGKQ